MEHLNNDLLQNNLYKYTKLSYFQSTNNIKIINNEHRRHIIYLNLTSISDPNNLVLSSLKELFPILQVLYLPNHFNQYIKSSDFGPNLKSIIFGDEFANNSFSFGCGNVLPIGIEKVEFGFKFNNEICKGSLPSTLKSLVLGYSWNLDANKLNLPNELEELKFGRGFNRALVNFKLPSNLKSLVIKSNVTIGESVLPHGLKELRLLDEYCSAFKSNKVLPSTLEVLEIGNYFKEFDLNPILKYLQSLTILKLGDEYDYKFKQDCLPSSLTQLEIANLTFNLDPGVLPSSIKKVVIKDSFSQKSNNISSTSPPIKTETSTYLIPGCFQNNQSLIEFKMGHYFNLPILPNILPSTLKLLCFGENYTSKLEAGSIPPSIESLVINNSYCLKNDTLINNINLVSLKINHQIFSTRNNSLDSIQFPINSNKLKLFESNLPLKSTIPDSVETLITHLPINLSYFQNLNSLIKLVVKGDSSTKGSINLTSNFDLMIIQLPKTIQHLELIDTMIRVANPKIVHFKLFKNLQTLIIKQAIIVQVNSQLLPNSIKQLMLIQINGLRNIDVTDLTNLESLEIKSPYSNVNSFIDIYQQHRLESINLPPQLKELILNINTTPNLENESNNQPEYFDWASKKSKKKQIYKPIIFDLPESLTKLVYNCIYNVINENINLPSTIQNLKLHQRFVSVNSNTLLQFIPPSVDELTFYYYGHNLNFKLPNQLNLSNIKLYFKIKNNNK